VTQHGNTVQVRTPGFTPADGTLADNALFTEAMAGAPAAPTSAAFIDVRNLQATFGASAATVTAFGPVKAVGITTAHSGDDGVALIRIVIR
jgi:hypothetical protein